jgi:hypothetical protein
MLLAFFLWGYSKDMFSKTLVASLNEMKLRIVAATETFAPKMLENTWKETEYAWTS